MIGYIGRLIPGMPRGVGHTAHSIFRDYNLFISANPQSTFDEAARFVLKSRKSTYRKTNDEEISFFLEISDSPGDLITIAVNIEDPDCFNSINEHTTRSSLRHFYQKYCPSEIKSIAKINFILRSVHEKRSRYKVNLNVLSVLTESFVFAFEEADWFRIGQTVGYISKKYLDDTELKIMAKEMIENIMDADETSAVCIMMPLIKYDNEARPHIETGFSAITSGDMQLAFDEFIKAFSIVKRKRA